MVQLKPSLNYLIFRCLVPLRVLAVTLCTLCASLCAPLCENQVAALAAATTPAIRQFHFLKINQCKT
jgi:hypothetical protein